MNRQITTSLITLLGQLGEMLYKLSDEQYTINLPILSAASLGAHVRHIIEFFQELEHGYLTGYVDYDARLREKAIENQRDYAIEKLHQIVADLKQDSKTLQLAYKPNSELPAFRVETNYERELVYNLEHAVHHMALLRIGVSALSDMELPAGFGVANSTIQYRQAQCVQ
jgi:hypothetical protein